jgi:3-hydroxyisobutyrate dehydrogenase
VFNQPFTKPSESDHSRKNMKIGIAGIGKMGAAVCSRLLALGQDVTIWNRSTGRCNAAIAAGAQWAESPRILAESVDVIITLLTDEAALDAVFEGTHGLLAGSVVGKVFIDMSTVKPAKPKELHQRVQSFGATFIECPVGGSVGPAKEGKLLGFVGGDEKDIAKVSVLLGQLCRRVEHVGPHGAGATMKLAVNLPLMVYWQTLSESLSLLAPLGLSPQRVIDILSDSSGGPNMLKVRGGMIAKTLLEGKSDQVTVSVTTMRKDMRAMLAQAEATHTSLPLTSLALDKFNQAAAEGLDAKDCSELTVWWLAKGQGLAPA